MPCLYIAKNESVQVGLGKVNAIPSPGEFRNFRGARFQTGNRLFLLAFNIPLYQPGYVAC